MPLYSNVRHLRDLTLCHRYLLAAFRKNRVLVSISAELKVLHIKEIDDKALRYVTSTFEISFMQVLRRQKGCQTSIKTFGISFADSYETLLFKFWNIVLQR